MGFVLRMLAYVTGAINRELLLKNEYLMAENKVLRAQIKGRLALTDEDRRTLATLGVELGRRLLAEVAGIVTPDTIFRWYRDLVAKKFDGSKNRKSPGRPPTSDVIESLVLKFARENASWGYRRIVGALANVGHEISHQTVADILDRNGVDPAPVRRKGMGWKEFLRTHMSVMAATDFFTVEVLTLQGLVTYYVLFVMDLASRRVHLAGITDSPHETWMKTVAIQLTAEYGFLKGKRFLIHDRDAKFTAAFRAILNDAGTEPLVLPAHSPNLNAFAERWVRTIKSECLSKIVFFGEQSLWRAVRAFLAHYHAERNHQGLGNALIEPRAEDRVDEPIGKIACRERLGGLLKFYHRRAS